MTPREVEGLAAQRAGKTWWNNPYPPGSVEAYQWDAGHTLGRRQARNRGRGLPC